MAYIEHLEGKIYKLFHRKKNMKIAELHVP